MQDGIGATRRHHVEGTVESQDGKPEQVSGEVEFLRTKDGVLVRAQLSLVEPEVCSRCLNPLDETIVFSFEEEFQATADYRSGDPITERDPDAFTIDENHMLDLTEAVRQYREVSAVMQPLCRPDCRGLCPNCGQDWNRGDCACDKGTTDSRWAALAALRGSIAEGKD
jgi:uncharacterized protein